MRQNPQLTQMANDRLGLSSVGTTNIQTRHPLLFIQSIILVLRQKPFFRPSVQMLFWGELFFEYTVADTEAERH